MRKRIVLRIDTGIYATKPAENGEKRRFCYVYRYATWLQRCYDGLYYRGCDTVTITALARQFGCSTMTVYRRCEKNGIVVGDYRDGPNGELTAEGVAVIAALFDTTSPQMAVTDDATQMQPGPTGDAQTTSQGPVDASTAVLQARLDGATALIEQLQGERDELRRQLAAAQAALAAEIADRQQERRLLTGSVDTETGEPAAQPRRRWRWPWARG